MARLTVSRDLLRGIAIGAVAAGAAAIAIPRLLRAFRGTTPRLDGSTIEERLIAFVFANATSGDAASVLAAIDRFCWTQGAARLALCCDVHAYRDGCVCATCAGFMMNVGDVKGELVKAEITRAAPNLALEFGGYCGYSAVLLGSLLPGGSRLISIELNPTYAAIATKIIEFAGLGEKVSVMVSDVESALPRIAEREGKGSVDLVFIDHWKDRYLPDLRNLEASGLLHVGSTIVADNIIYPGAPDYLAYVTTSPRYRTVVHDTLLEYSKDRKDAVTVSTVLTA